MAQTFEEFYQSINISQSIHTVTKAYFDDYIKRAYTAGYEYAESEFTNEEESEESLDEKYTRITEDINNHMDENKRPLPTYTRNKCKKFVIDMYENNFEETLDHYEGRFYYKGPSVTIGSKDLCKVIRATTVDLQWDTLGKNNLIVYPAN